MIRKMAETLGGLFAFPLIGFPRVEAMATNIVDKQSQRGEETNSQNATISHSSAQHSQLRSI